MTPAWTVVIGCLAGYGLGLFFSVAVILHGPRVYTAVRRFQRHALRVPILAILALILWIVTLQAVFGLENLRVLLGWTIGPEAP